MKINETTGLYENYGVWHVPFWHTQWFIIAVKVAIGLFLCLVCLLLVRWYIVLQRRKKLSPKEQLLADLEALKSENKVSVALGKEFYSSLSDIIKRYFFYCYGYDVLTKTDAELLHYLQQEQVDEAVVQEMKDILRGSEIIKFANAQAAQERILADYERVLGMVRKTVEQMVKA